MAPFFFLDAPGHIFSTAQVPMPVLPAAWPRFWRHGQWNEFRARIVGNPAHVITWINGVQFLDWRDTMPRASEGYLALQLHSGVEFVHGQNWVGRRGVHGRRDGLHEAHHSASECSGEGTALTWSRRVTV